MPGPLSLLGTVAPPLAAEVSYHLWRDLGTPERVHARDRPIHERATIGELTVGGEPIVVYTWGTGPQVVLLVHGWRSRASRFSALVDRLESPERTIVAFDAPGNGDTPGSGTTILDYAAIIARLGQRYGEFDAIVGHSFGALSMFFAVREDVRARRLVSISGMYNVDEILRGFSYALGIGGRTVRGLRRRIERRIFPGIPNLWGRFVAEIDPAHVSIPVLLIHDEDDAVIASSQLDLIAGAHTGSVTRLVTTGLGHTRVLHDPAVTAAIERYLA